MQPIIGITMCYDNADLINQGVEYNYIRREYSVAVRRAGAQPIFLDPSIDPLVAAKLCDGIVISGGEDIDPTFYSQPVHSTDNQEPRIRTEWERKLIDACDEWNRPILGICYGEQLLNVHYGGTLYQDIITEYAGVIDHGTSQAAAHHPVVFEHDFLGFHQHDQVDVTARHHQAIRDLAEGFTVIARSSDGVMRRSLATATTGSSGMQNQMRRREKSTPNLSTSALFDRARLVLYDCAREPVN